MGRDTTLSLEMVNENGDTNICDIFYMRKCHSMANEIINLCRRFGAKELFDDYSVCEIEFTNLELIDNIYLSFVRELRAGTWYQYKMATRTFDEDEDADFNFNAVWCLEDYLPIIADCVQAMAALCEWLRRIEYYEEGITLEDALSNSYEEFSCHFIDNIFDFDNVRNKLNEGYKFSRLIFTDSY